MAPEGRRPPVRATLHQDGVGDPSPFTITMIGLRVVRSFTPVATLWVGKLIIDAVVDAREKALTSRDYGSSSRSRLPWSSGDRCSPGHRH